MLHDVVQVGWAKYVLQQVSTMQSPRQTPTITPKVPQGRSQKNCRSQSPSLHHAPLQKAGIE